MTEKIPIKTRLRTRLSAQTRTERRQVPLPDVRQVSLKFHHARRFPTKFQLWVPNHGKTQQNMGLVCSYKSQVLYPMPMSELRPWHTFPSYKFAHTISHGYLLVIKHGSEIQELII